MNFRTVVIDGEPHAISFSEEPVRIEPRTGVAFTLNEGEELTITDPYGEQVADFTAFMASDTAEWLSGGRTIDYANRIYLKTGDTLYSNRSNPMLEIIEDTAGRHDFLLAPCSQEMFARLYGITEPRPSCFGNLHKNLMVFDILPDSIPTTLNLFMNVVPNSKSGELTIGPPHSTAGDNIVLRARNDLVVGITACSAEKSNNGTFKPIDFNVASPCAEMSSDTTRSML